AKLLGRSTAGQQLMYARAVVAHIIKQDGRSFGGGLFQAEVDYLVQHEWAQRVDDIIWRRSKKGLGMSQADIDALHDYLSEQRNSGSNAA
ncbi:MAG: hypothetical protein AAF404_00800, partial [Pseudomonadota bacterium]